jgi:hypothetical protein
MTLSISAIKWALTVLGYTTLQSGEPIDVSVPGPVILGKRDDRFRGRPRTRRDVRKASRGCSNKSLVETEATASGNA